MAGATLSELFDGIAALFGATGQPLRAARLFGAADTQWLASGAKRYPLDDLRYERDLRAVRAQLEDEDFADAAKHTGMTYRALIQRLVNLALEGRAATEA